MSALDDPLKPARDAAFLKLGRNIALFQQLEAGLKSFYESLVVEGGSLEDAERRRARRSKVLATRSLGLVVKKLFEELTASNDDTADPTVSAGRAHVRIRIGMEGLLVDARRQAMEGLIDERNQLVHHLNSNYDLRSAEGIGALDDLLDPQASRIRDELRAWQELFQHHLEARQALAEWMASPEAHQFVELQFLRASRLICGFTDLAAELKRKDGWTGLSQAASTLRQRDSAAFDNLKARYGSARIKPLLMASGLFELRDETAARGGVRVLYRLIDPQDSPSGIALPTV